MKKYTTTFVSVALLLFATTFAICQTQQRTRVLFIGNSYTYFNNLPTLFSQLSASADPAKIVEAKMVVEGGATLQKLWNEGNALKMLHQEHWDYVVLQEQSTLGETQEVNGIPQINDPTAFFKAAQLFDAEIKKAGAKTVFYMTWARRNSPESQVKLSDAYMHIAQELGAVVAPVGNAWQTVLKKNPEIVLYQVDNSHPTPAGSYLAACVIFATLFHQTPVGLTSRIVGRPVDMEGHILNTEEAGLIASTNDVELVNLDNEISGQLQVAAWNATNVGAVTASSPGTTKQEDWDARLKARIHQLIEKNGPGTDAELQQELTKMFNEDQGIRTRLISAPEKERPELRKEMKAIDFRMTARLRQIVSEKGWPTISLVGVKASRAAATLLIHSPDHDWQATLLPQLQDLVANDNIIGCDVALVIDKIRVAHGELQEFGTQFKDDNGKLVMLPVRDPERLEERRAQYLLPPMGVYRKMLSDTYHVSVE